MPNVVWVAGGFVAFGAVGMFLTAAILSHRARSRAWTALNNLEDEIAQARRGSAEKYRTLMPGRDKYVDELSCCEEMITHWRARFNALTQETPFMGKLCRPWRAACNEITFRANGAVRELQGAAFWAQFEPGSEAAECRFKD